MHVRDPHRGIYLLTILCFVLLVIPHHFQTVNAAEGYKVIGPDQPVVAVLGGDAELPCRLSPPLSAQHMQVRWFRSRFDSLVHLYENGKDQNEEQIPEYRGRTELIRTHISNGSVSLRIHNVGLKDEGRYTCFFRSDTYYEEAMLELKVAGLGTAPSISITDHQDRGIGAVCECTGWYPEPEVTWGQEDGQSLTSLSETITQGYNGLFNVKTSLLLETNQYGNISCRIRNIILSEERESVISISLVLQERKLADAFSWRVSRWMVSLPIILGSLLISSGLLAALVVHHLRKQCKERADVTLDLETAHPDLVLCEDRKSIRAGDTRQNLFDSPQSFDESCSVLGCDRFNSGRHYWEVEIAGYVKTLGADAIQYTQLDVG
ncbi:butyrophilin subfamily 1 member A1-like [Rhinatrema bivittatum]|uniref:butyrophilin subfamily 1 member A1-like n=1 Tax=Rhinatrema bivittatum TaxID=194408 RepID=UPI00112E75B9|nr:butyrophilin subfamily 1 member A1-like [Rhinatrema bivittatum]